MQVMTLIEILSQCPPNASVIKVDKSGWGLTDVVDAKSQPVLFNYRNDDYRGPHQAFGAYEYEDRHYMEEGVILLAAGEVPGANELMVPLSTVKRLWIEDLKFEPGMSRIDKAIAFATKAHTGQKRKGTNIDYIVHPLAVAKLLTEAGCNEDTIIAGYLHDAVEDNEKISLEDIARIFGYRVAGIVEACSEPDKALPWKERKTHTIEMMKTAPTAVRLVVTCDKLHNATCMLNDYKSCGMELWERFNESRENQQWYYLSLVESLGVKKFDTHPLHIALAKTVEELFTPRSTPAPVKWDEMLEFDYEWEFYLHHGKD